MSEDPSTAPLKSNLTFLHSLALIGCGQGDGQGRGPDARTGNKLLQDAGADAVRGHENAGKNDY